MKKPLIFQSDFGLDDGAVCAMYGVAYMVDESLSIVDLTHNIPQYNVWESSYRLIQAVKYWPQGSVFVSVVDPGVGSSRKSIVAETIDKKYIVTPDNGTITHIKRKFGLSSVRIIDESKNRLPDSKDSYTFYGRDVYAYTGAKLASGIIKFEEVGPLLDINNIVELKVDDPTIESDSISGIIDVLDVRFGSIWSNISEDFMKKIGVSYGDTVQVSIKNGFRELYKSDLTYAKSFAEVNMGEVLVYINSLGNVSVAINQGSFARAYNISSGRDWTINIKKIN